jgi:hypothetical protein
MLGYEFELAEPFDNNRFIEELNNAKQALCKYHDVDEKDIVRRSMVANKTGIFNQAKYLGVHQIFNVLKGEDVIEILDCFVSNQNEYMIIFSHPTN